MGSPGWFMRKTCCRAIAVAILIAATVAIMSASQSSNCGGNSAALHDVKWYSLIARSAAAERPDHSFSVAQATPREREELAQIANDFWIHGARFLVSPLPFKQQAPQPPRLIIVCDRAYKNVPRRLIGSAPATHAAAFSDGSCRLISVAEFEAIDRSSLIPLDELLTTSGP